MYSQLSCLLFLKKNMFSLPPSVLKNHPINPDNKVPSIDPQISCKDHWWCFLFQVV